MNKADFIALINAKLPTGNLIPAVDHRSTMHTDPNSIIELVYGDNVFDDSLTENITTKNNNFSYSVSFHKTGNNINISGRFTALNTVSGAIILEISNSDYFPIDNFSFTQMAHRTNIDDTITVLVTNQSGIGVLRTTNPVISGETFYFNFNYKALN